MDLYHQERTKPLDEVFAQPGSVYRGTPFWSWNSDLKQAQLLRQIEIFKEMGLGGFHMHSRVGLNTAYLGDDFLECVRACVDKARAEGLLAWLYDEDRWPSGAAGGIVTRNHDYRMRYLCFLPEKLASGESAGIIRDGVHLGTYSVSLVDGRLAKYRRVQVGENRCAGDRIWHAYRVLHAPRSWYNGQTYLDTLNPQAVQEFIAVTHESYKRAVGSEFGKTVPAIFTDEPRYGNMSHLGYADEEVALSLPYTDDFPETFKAEYGEDFLSTLPELVWELSGGKRSIARYRYYAHLTNRFANSFSDQIGRWCERNGLCFTGHMMEEPTLASQTCTIGDAMRHYRLFQLPGIDMLCGRQELNTAKQAQSVSRQYGRSGVLSELYGVTGWDYSFAQHKAHGDWQAALGVSVRVHHLSWLSMRGEAKRDYPASIFYQSPWYKRYPVVEDHFARVHAALTRGKPLTRVGVIHPIESFWLIYGCAEQTAVERNEQENHFANLPKWLLFGQIDFDYINESLLPEQCPVSEMQKDLGFRVGEMAYETVIVPPLLTMRRSTLERLRAFADCGGEVIFAGRVAQMVDCIPSPEVELLAGDCRQISFSRDELLMALEHRRDLDVRRYNNEPEDGERHEKLLYQVRAEGETRLLFLCCTQGVDRAEGCRICLSGEWIPEFMNTQDGSFTRYGADYREGKTIIEYTFFEQSHILLRLHPGRRIEGPRFLREHRHYGERDLLWRFHHDVEITLHEPNALLLDQAEWRINQGEWQPKEEVLRLCNQARHRLGLQQYGDIGGEMMQPWVRGKDEAVLGVIELRHTIQSTTAQKGLRLAVELAAGETITFDDTVIDTTPTGWWVDESISTVALPDFDAGTHILLRKIPYQKTYSLEWSYLLGDFGVQVSGRDAWLTESVQRLRFGDICGQGLPFYTGNITYHCVMDFPVDEPTIAVPFFNGALVDVVVDGGSQLPLAAAPYRVKLHKIMKGLHRVDLIYYGTRGNAFNPLHWTVPQLWISPDAWRTSGDLWCYEYQLHPAGILTQPFIVA